MGDFILNLVRRGAGVATDVLVRPLATLNFAPNLNAVQTTMPRSGMVLDDGPIQDIPIQRAVMSTPTSSQLSSPLPTAEPTRLTPPLSKALPFESQQQPVESTPTKFSTEDHMKLLPAPVQDQNSVAATRTLSSRSSFQDWKSKSEYSAISRPKPKRDPLAQPLPIKSEVPGEVNESDRSVDFVPSLPSRPPEREQIVQPGEPVKPKPKPNRDPLAQPLPSASEIPGEVNELDRSVELAPSSSSHQPVRPTFRPRLTGDEFVRLDAKSTTISQKVKVTHAPIIRGTVESESVVRPKPIAPRVMALPSLENRQNLAQLPRGSKSNQPADTTSENRSVQVHIGTIEVQAASPPHPAPRINPQGFADYERIRTYMNWYEY